MEDDILGMKVLFCGLKHEYGKVTAGLSFEYQNFYHVLQNMPGVQANMFEVDVKMVELGRDKMNELLIETVKLEKPDLLFCFLFTEEIKKSTIQYITTQTQTKTFNWFADDHWRFHTFSKYWAPLFTAVGTTDSHALEKYKKIKNVKVIHTQWGVNPKLFFPQLEKEYDVTFVGQNYSTRQQYVNYLTESGIEVQTFGTGWSSGRIPKEQTAKIWSGSKINLNFTEGSNDSPKAMLKLFAKLFIKKEFGKYRFNGFSFLDNLKSALNSRVKQIKSRNFEIPACGGFLITGDADNLKDYYIDGKEIVIFKTKEDLVNKINYYLNHPQEVKDIAKAGLKRTLQDHTYEKRFSEIFNVLDLK